MVLVGLAAGGNAGKASEPAGPITVFRGGPRDAGREVGGVGRAELGLEDGVWYEVVGLTHGVAPIRLARVELFVGRVGTGRPGNGFADEADAEPQDAVRDAVDRDDCAVDDFSFKTRDVLFGGAGVELDGAEVT